MNPSNRAVLKRYHDDLAKDIEVTEELLGKLYQADVFDRGMVDFIRCQPSSSDKTQKLLEMLPKRGPDAMGTFIKVIESTYPWLASLLASSLVKTKRESYESSKTIARPQDNQKPADIRVVDPDIKCIVSSFLHRQFGQSKRVTEKDKKKVEKFMADQIQRERTRYQSLLSPQFSPSPTNSMDSGMNNVTEVQNTLFSMHVKLERFIMSTCKNSHSCSAADRHDGPSHHHYHVHHDGHDDDGHPDHRNQPPAFPRDHIITWNQSCAGDEPEEESRPPKLLPEDMDFELVNNKIDVILRHIQVLEAKMADCLQFFDSRDYHHPLSSLVENLAIRCQCQERDMAQDRAHIKQLMNEAQSYSDHIERLEKERLELRKQIQAVYQDMAVLRQKNSELQGRIAKMEEKRQHQAEDSSGGAKLRLGLASKTAKTTPRGQTKAAIIAKGDLVGGAEGRHYGIAGGTTGNGGVGAGNEDGFSRRSGIKTTQQSGIMHFNYVRRHPQGGRSTTASTERGQR